MCLHVALAASVSRAAIARRGFGDPRARGLQLAQLVIVKIKVLTGTRLSPVFRVHLVHEASVSGTRGGVERRRGGGGRSVASVQISEAWQGRAWIGLGQVIPMHKSTDAIGS
ncbi:unnamed protein product [Lampetra planeri]